MPLGHHEEAETPWPLMRENAKAGSHFGPKRPGAWISQTLGHDSDDLGRVRRVVPWYHVLLWERLA